MAHQLSSKRQRENNGSEDLLSQLPESLISCILSFLSTKDAVRTSVLSKKWRFKWTCMTKLVMDDSDFNSRKKTKQCFLNFMNRILLFTKWESFSLVIGANKYDSSVVNAWISSILHRGVRNLCIESYLELSFSALTSHFLFHCYSLEELVLDMKHYCAVVVPSIYVCFVYLKFLKLSGIKFTHEDPNYSDLNLSFPVLQRFETKNCTWLMKGINVYAPLLENVLIEHDPNSLSHEPVKCSIKFSASKLKNFTYHCHGHISQDVVLLDRSSAHNASANITTSCISKDRVAETGNSVILLLKQLNQVQYLKFEGSEVLAQSRLGILHSFVMLSHLELGLVTFEILLGLLLKSPVLKTLVFKELSKFDQERLNSATVPDCFVSTLQMVKFGRVHGYDHELCFAKFVLENGLVLERLSFHSWPYKLKAIEEFKEKLFSFKKDFKSYAIVEFSYGY